MQQTEGEQKNSNIKTPDNSDSTQISKTKSLLEEDNCLKNSNNDSSKNIEIGKRKSQIVFDVPTFPQPRKSITPIFYDVCENDTFESIADKFGISLSWLNRQNLKQFSDPSFNLIKGLKINVTPPSRNLIKPLDCCMKNPESQNENDRGEHGLAYIVIFENSFDFIPDIMDPNHKPLHVKLTSFNEDVIVFTPKSQREKKKKELEKNNLLPSSSENANQTVQNEKELNHISDEPTKNNDEKAHLNENESQTAQNEKELNPITDEPPKNNDEKDQLKENENQTAQNGIEIQHPNEDSNRNPAEPNQNNTEKGQNTEEKGQLSDVPNERAETNQAEELLVNKPPNAAPEELDVVSAENRADDNLNSEQKDQQIQAAEIGQTDPTSTEETSAKIDDKDSVLVATYYDNPKDESTSHSIYLRVKKEEGNQFSIRLQRAIHEAKSREKLRQEQKQKAAKQPEVATASSSPLGFFQNIFHQIKESFANLEMDTKIAVPNKLNDKDKKLDNFKRPPGYRRSFSQKTVDNALKLSLSNLSKSPLEDKKRRNSESINFDTAQSTRKLLATPTISKIAMIDGPSAIFETTDEVDEVRAKFPFRYKMHDWMLIYRLSRDGSSSTIFFNYTRNQNPIVLIISTSTKERIGAFLPTGIKYSQKYYGSGEAFVFRLVKPENNKKKGKRSKDNVNNNDNNSNNNDNNNNNNNNNSNNNENNVNNNNDNNNNNNNNNDNNINNNNNNNNDNNINNNNDNNNNNINNNNDNNNNNSNDNSINNNNNNNNDIKINNNDNNNNNSNDNNNNDSNDSKVNNNDNNNNNDDNNSNDNNNNDNNNNDNSNNSNNNDNINNNSQSNNDNNNNAENSTIHTTNNNNNKENIENANSNSNSGNNANNNESDNINANNQNSDGLLANANCSDNENVPQQESGKTGPKNDTEDQASKKDTSAHIEAFRWVPGTNTNFMMSVKGTIIIGIGESSNSPLNTEMADKIKDDRYGPAIWIGEELRNASSSPCQSFGSPQLTKKNKFNIVDIEIWKVGLFSKFDTS